MTGCGSRTEGTGNVTSDGSPTTNYKKGRYSMQYSKDIYTENPADPDTLANLGPLSKR